MQSFDAFSLTGKGVLVTGAAGNLGRKIAEMFCAAGARVVLHYRSGEDAARRLQREIGAVGVLRADVACPGEGRALVERAVELLGGLDVLVNNAGAGDVQCLQDMGRAEWSYMQEVNLASVFELSAAAFAHAQDAAEGGLSIVHIASIEGVRPAKGHAHYAAAKAGLLMHARAAALEYGGSGVRVNCVSPGLISRPGISSEWPEGVASWLARAPLARLVDPGDVAAACLFLASPLARCVTGQNLVVDCGMLTTPGW